MTRPSSPVPRGVYPLLTITLSKISKWGRHVIIQSKNLQHPHLLLLFQQQIYLFFVKLHFPFCLFKRELLLSLVIVTSLLSFSAICFAYPNTSRGIGSPCLHPQYLCLFYRSMHIPHPFAHHLQSSSLQSSV